MAIVSIIVCRHVYDAHCTVSTVVNIDNLLANIANSGSYNVLILRVGVMRTVVGVIRTASV